MFRNAPSAPPWAQNDIQKRAQILHKSIPGCTDGGGILPRFRFEHLLATFPHLEKCDIMSRFFLRNTYWQHCPMFKNVVACCVFPFNICCQHSPMFRNVILCRVFSVFKWTVAFFFLKHLLTSFPYVPSFRCTSLDQYFDQGALVGGRPWSNRGPKFLLEMWFSWWFRIMTTSSTL